MGGAVAYTEAEKSWKDCFPVGFLEGISIFWRGAECKILKTGILEYEMVKCGILKYGILESGILKSGILKSGTLNSESTRPRIDMHFCLQLLIA